MPKIDYINVWYNLPKPLEPQQVSAQIRVEIIGPFGIHESYKNLGKFTITLVSYGYRLSYSDDFDTFEEARRAAKRLMKVKITWTEMTKLVGGYNGNHVTSKYDTGWLISLTKSVRDEFWKIPDYKEFYNTAVREIEEQNK